MKLRPASYLLKREHNTQRHLGFIAQDIDDARIETNLTKDELSLLESFEQENDSGKMETYMGIRYEEFIPICVHMIQKMSKQIDALESKLKGVCDNAEK